MSDEPRHEGVTWAAAVAQLEPALIRLAERLAVLEGRLADVAGVASGVRADDAMDALREEMRATLAGASEALRDVVQVNLEDAIAAIRGETASAQMRVTAVTRQLEERFAAVRHDVDERVAGLEGPIRASIDAVATAVEDRANAILAAVDAATARIAHEAVERAREQAPDLQEVLADLRLQIDRATSAGREEAAAPVERLRASVETEIQRLREQVAYGMSALVRQLDAMRRTSPPPRGDVSETPSAPPFTGSSPPQPSPGAPQT